MLSSKSCEAFLAVAESGSFDEAAQRLCITSSAVTLRVQALEKDLGQILLLRERPALLHQDLIQALQENPVLKISPSSIKLLHKRTCLPMGLPAPF